MPIVFKISRINAGMMLISSQVLNNNLKLTTMGNKLWALALVGAAAYLFKTKKGNELRKQMMDAGGKVAQQLKDKYQESKAGVVDRLDAQTA
jgi:hypothetical protein